MNCSRLRYKDAPSPRRRRWEFWHHGTSVSVNVTVTEQSKAASEEHVHCHVQPPGGLGLWTDEPHSYACPLSTLSRVQSRLIWVTARPTVPLLAGELPCGGDGHSGLRYNNGVPILQRPHSCVAMYAAERPSPSRKLAGSLGVGVPGLNNVRYPVEVGYRGDCRINDCLLPGWSSITVPNRGSKHHENSAQDKSNCCYHWARKGRESLGQEIVVIAIRIFTVTVTSVFLVVFSVDVILLTHSYLIWLTGRKKRKLVHHVPFSFCLFISEFVKFIFAPCL